MSVARACRRYRIKMKHDPRYNRATRRDAGVRAARDAKKWAEAARRKQGGAK